MSPSRLPLFATVVATLVFAAVLPAGAQNRRGDRDYTSRVDTTYAFDRKLIDHVVALVNEREHRWQLPWAAQDVTVAAPS